MKMILLRSLLALALVAITLVGISCADNVGVGTQGGALQCTLKQVDYDQPGTSADPRKTRARICPFPLNARGLADLKRILGSDPSLYQIRVYKNGTVSEIWGSMSYSVPAAGQTTPDLSQGDIEEADRVAKQQSPPFNGVTIQAGRGRGGAATMNPDKALVANLKAFFDSH